ncbi:MAG: hypothetical protein K5920_12070 [Bacteroidales bacterium]|nr:hypothetical protein [Bacteroidales bacterium]
MNKYDEELLKNSPSMIKGIAVEADRLNGDRHLMFTLDDVRGMTEFGLALGGQISEADNVSAGKLITECIIGGALIGAFIALMAANFANKIAKRDNTLLLFQPIQLPDLYNAETNARLDALERMYHLR